MNNHKLKPFEFYCLSYFILRAGYLGVTSYNILHIAKQDSIISILVGMILGLIPFSLFLYLYNHYPNDSIFDLTKKVFGKIGGKIINFLLMIGVAFCIIMLSYNLISFIHSQYLNRTPTLAISILFGVAILYTLSKKITIIGRANVILFYFSLGLFLLAAIGLLSQSDFNRLKPILESGWFSVLKGSFSFIAFNSTPIILLSCIPKNTIEEDKHFNRNMILTYLFASLTLLITMYCVLSVFGPNLALLYQYPEFHLLKLISLVGLINRVEGIIALQWLYDLFVCIVIGLYFICEYLKKDFSIQKKYSHTIFITLYVILVFIVENIFRNNTIKNWFTIYFSPWIATFFFFIIPLVIYIKCHYQKKKQ